jgi:hypothetical protein
MASEQVKKLVPTLIMAVALLGLASPIIGVSDPADPFQKAKALALVEGRPYEGKSDKMSIVVIKGWGAIIYAPGKEVIMLTKGTPSDNSQIAYDEKQGKYVVSRVIKGGKPEMTFVDRPEAMDIANKYLREIEAARGNK